MSSEECPFCGKTYKRLKSHLPHCKAAANTQTTKMEHHIKSKQTTPSAQLVTGISEVRAKAKKSSQMLSVEANPKSKESSKVSPQSSSPALTAKNINASSPSLSSSLLPPSTKKKKQKLSEQIKTGSAPSSNTTAPSLSTTISKKKSLRAQIEAVKHDQVTKRSQDGTRSASEDLLSETRSKTPAQTRTDVIPDDTKPKDGSKKKMSKTKKAAAQSLPTDSDSLDSELNQSIVKPVVRDNSWVDNAPETEDLSVKKMFLKSDCDHQARITIQNVKTTLNRAKTTTQSSRASFLSQTDLNNNLKTSFGPALSPVTAPVENDVSCIVANKTLSEQLPCTQLQPFQKSSKSLIPLQRDGSSQPKLPLTVPLLPSGHTSSQVSQATGAGSMTEALKVGHRMTDFLSLSTSPLHFSSPYLFPLASRNTLQRAETLRAEDVAILEDRKPKAAHNLTKDAVTQRSLGQVRLRELPEWLVCRTPSHPRDVVEMVHRGWQWYYRRYIDVKKGGVGGVAMLLAGYCVLSYVWSYPHISKRMNFNECCCYIQWMEMTVVFLFFFRE
ncbi:hypothetical protein JOB18_036489 [Solea senegalensis]|uniref:ATP synthase membrane subunit f n=2 Tax=Solea senegalensis TaxID=28829 RepID=A0AAV6RRB6_SOLSE|nr:uncharacterized protein si:dkey-21c1.4 isoform X1 [Solea senegalensis]XP_043869614.1 uncharacterized protein si:dkey-21c1.4 isoform X1 [Solea senegalensis]KAG7507507.1 hypothetical protein JOB18_036489 [Solea senegalensis]KAG7507509.1 hypothetical protein JOB18_036489 [Solea senegalensis]